MPLARYRHHTIPAGPVRGVRPVVDPGPVKRNVTLDAGLLPFVPGDEYQLAGLGSFLKKVKKAVSIKNIVKVAKKAAPIAALVAPLVPVVGTFAIAKTVSKAVKSASIAKKIGKATRGIQRVQSAVKPFARAFAPQTTARIERAAQQVQQTFAPQTPFVQLPQQEQVPVGPDPMFSPSPSASNNGQATSQSGSPFGGISPALLIGGAVALLVLPKLLGGNRR